MSIYFITWSYSTSTLIHRWVARLFLFQTLLHSIFALVTAWWIWACVATVAAVIMVLTSFLIIRQRPYELFLVTHLVMAVIFLVGCWYHIWYQYEGTFGYETWPYATIAVWFFNRLVRLARIMKTGIRGSKVTEITPMIVRIDIPGIRLAAPGPCVYVYFPTLHALTPWESHPFSIIPTPILTGRRYNNHAESDFDNVEENQKTTVSSKTIADNKAYTNSGVTLFVRKRAEITGFLKAQDNLLTLLERPYPTNPSKATLQSDQLLLIGGGISITRLLSYTSCHPNLKLMLSVKTVDKDLVTSLKHVLDEVREKHIIVGARLDIEALLREEANLGWSRIAFVVCGPASMCDHVREVVTRLGKEKAGDCLFELEVDEFSW